MGNSRRKFLQNSLLASAGLGLSNSSFANSQENEFSSEEAMVSNGTITLLQTTDVHCQIHAHDELFWENKQAVFRKTGGYAHIATLINQARKKNPNTIVIDTGDMFQGSELSVKSQGKALLPILNQINYDIYTPGNWEVFFYKKGMQQLLGALNAPKVCANMYHDLGNGKRGELIFQPYQTITKLGVKIGFLGYTDHLVPKRQSPALSKGIVYTKPEENLKYYVEVLKEQEQCQYIIILSHLGLSQQIALANHPDCEGVNYIFGGDTHERVRKPIQCKYSKVVEPGAFGSFVGKLELTVSDGKILSENYELLEVTPEKYKADKQISQIIEKNENPFRAEMNKVLGYSTVPLYRYFVVENTIDTLITDALKWKVGVDIALSNGFRFCPPKAESKNGLIPITESFLYDMIPVDANVRIGKVTGKQLIDWLEVELENVFAKDAAKRFGGWLVRFNGMTLEFNAFVPQGQKIQKLEIGGKALDLDKIYTISACEREGDAEDILCRMKGVKETKSLSYTLHDAIKEYLAKFSPVTPNPKQSAKILDGSQQLLSQVWGVDYQFK